MSQVSAFTRYCLNMQGYVDLDDEAKSRYALPLRFSPIVCTILIAVGMGLQSPIWLGVVAVVALIGAALPAAIPSISGTTWLSATCSVRASCRPILGRDDLPALWLPSSSRVRHCLSSTVCRCWDSPLEVSCARSVSSSPLQIGALPRGCSG